MNTLLVITDIVAAVITVSIAVRLFQLFGMKESISNTVTTIFALIAAAAEIVSRVVFGKTATILGTGFFAHKSAMGETVESAFTTSGTLRIVWTGWLIETAVILLMLLISAFIFKTRKVYAVFISVLFTAIIMFGEAGVLKLLPYIAGISEAASFCTAYYFIGAVGLRLIIFVILTAFYYETQKARNRACIYGGLKKVVTLFIIPLVTVIFAYAAFECEVKIGFLDEYVWNLAAEILAVADIVLILGFEHISINTNEKIKTNIAIQQAAYKADYYKGIAENRKITDKTMHDLRNRMFALRDSFAEDNDAGIRKLEEICTAMSGNMIQNITGNDTIDALIAAKRMQMNEADIEFNSTCFVHSFGNVTNDDLSVILGNLLDNALEACQNVKEGKRKISLEMIQKGDFLGIAVINSIAKKVIIEKGKIKTTKKEKGTHGFGLKNTEETAAKYSGTISFDQTAETFTASVILCVSDI